MECQHKQRHWFLNLLDTSGVFASGLCAVHCILTPLFMILAPTLGGLFSHQAIHIFMFLLVLPIAVITLGFSAWRLRRWNLLLFGLLGCSLLALGLELEHHYEIALNSPSTWANISGGLILAFTHIYNLRTRVTHEFC